MKDGFGEGDGFGGWIETNYGGSELCADDTDTIAGGFEVSEIGINRVDDNADATKIEVDCVDGDSERI